MRTTRATPLCLSDRGTHGLLQLHRGLLQSNPAALRPGVSLAHLLRTGDANRPTVRHSLNRPRNRGNFKETAICIVDEGGKVVRETKVATEPEAIIAFLNSVGLEFTRIGLEAGPLSQWLVNGLAAVELPVICVETRHMKAILKAQQVNKSDRNDARGIAQMMRVGLYKPVHVKTLASQQQRMLLTGRK